MKKTKKVEKPNFTISITIGDEVYKGKGATALEALQSIKKPEKIVSKGVFTITDGVKKREVLMIPMRLKRLFYGRVFQQIQLKSLCLGMK